MRRDPSLRVAKQFSSSVRADIRNLQQVRNFLTFAPMILSRITSKAQTTVPRAVRAALGLSEGDQLVWSLGEAGRVTLRRRALADPADPFVNNFSTFAEWASEADCEAFDKL